MQIRAFVSNPHSTSKQELNQSPLAFVETASEPGLAEALKRKDNIIRVRNAQISALWDELHTRQPWKNAIKGEDIVSFPEDAANTTRKLAVLGINTVSPARPTHCLKAQTVPLQDNSCLDVLTGHLVVPCTLTLVQMQGNNFFLPARVDWTSDCTLHVNPCATVRQQILSFAVTADSTNVGVHTQCSQPPNAGDGTTASISIGQCLSAWVACTGYGGQDAQG